MVIFNLFQVLFLHRFNNSKRFTFYEGKIHGHVYLAENISGYRCELIQKMTRKPGNRSPSITDED